MSSLAFIPTKLQSMRVEFYRMGGHTPELKAYLHQCEIDHSTVTAHCGIIAVCVCSYFVANDGSSIFIFDPNGQPSVVIEALGLKDGTVKPVDLVSWPIGRPWSVATAVREAEILGPWNMVKRGGSPLKVFRCAEDWIKAGCQGCAPINKKLAGHWLRLARGPFIAQDIEHGREIRDLLGANASHHQVCVPWTKEAA